MNSELRLNIIAFDIPWPPNYGGVIDVYYKIRSLAELGVKINLHCFQYGREKSDKLLEYCDNVFYYPRKLLVNPLSVNLPYIVKTRKSDLLLKNLIESEGPLLFEGLHCTYYLNRPELKNRLKIVRMHNIEYIYYKHLAKVEKKFWKKIYYNNEASCLRNYQKVLDIADHVASISPNDHKILNLKHGNSFYLPVFHPNKEVTSRVGKGEYILYHGNLGVGENNEAALFLVKNVFSELKLPTVIAGTNPSSELKRQVREHYHIKLIDPGMEEMDQLLADAQINILPTFQETGIKLKLLNALYRGRYCIVNNKMVRNTGLSELCIKANKAKDMKVAITKYFDKEFDNTENKKRKELLNNKFNNKRNADMFIDEIMKH